MAWHQPGLPEPMMVSLLMHICITRPQRVKLKFPVQCSLWFWVSCDMFLTQLAVSTTQ